MNWQIKDFKELSQTQLYEVMALRQEVFVVEQNCPYLDADGKDKFSWHVLGYKKEQLIAYARIVAAGISYKEISIGRVVVKKTYRNKKNGFFLIEICHRFIAHNLGKQAIRLSAQSHLCAFYENLDYIPIGKEYLEDNIAHIEMLFEM